MTGIKKLVDKKRIKPANIEQLAVDTKKTANVKNLVVIYYKH